MSILNIETPETEYIHEKHVVSRCIYHIIFCPKYRRKVLVDGVEIRLKELIESKQNEYKFQLISLEIMPDHVHLLIKCSVNVSINSIIAKIKGYTSNILRNEFPTLKSRLPTLWTRGKFCASVGSVSLETVKKYINNQNKV